MDEYFHVRVVHERMGLRAESVQGKLGIVALIALTFFVSAARPLSRRAPSSVPQVNDMLGRRLTRSNLLSEPALDTDAPSPSPAAAELTVLAPPPAGVLPLALKTRQVAFRSVPFRRLKLPPRRAASSLSSD